MVGGREIEIAAPVWRVERLKRHFGVQTCETPFLAWNNRRYPAEIGIIWVTQGHWCVFTG
jgi:hypothetical protein